MQHGFDFTFFLPFVIFMIPFAIGNYFLAGRMGRNQVLWVVLTLIPVVNFIFIYYVMYVVVLYILDKLNKLTERPEATPS
ncbi:MAG: hypothetical protein ABJ215_09890 [Alphaproteobacteria bacterium]